MESGDVGEGRHLHALQESSLPGKRISTGRLAEIFLELQAQRANNINLVTPTHYVPHIVEAVRLARERGLRIPVVYNTGSIETPETIRSLVDTVDIFLPDLKFYGRDVAERYANMPDYFDVAMRAIEEMVEMRGAAKNGAAFGEQGAEKSGATVFGEIVRMRSGAASFEEKAMKTGSIAAFDERGMMTSGVIVRHMVLPGHTKDSKRILECLRESFGDRVYVSIMNQYTPMPGIGQRFPELGRRVTRREYARVVDYALELGFTNAYVQEGPAAGESFIPAFDGFGV